MHLRIDAINPFSYCSQIAAIREPLFSPTAPPQAAMVRPEQTRWGASTQGAKRKAPRLERLQPALAWRPVEPKGLPNK